MSASRLADSGDRQGTHPRRRTTTVIVAVLAILLLSLGVRLVQVHQQTWDWRLTPAAAPTLLQFDGRDYRRGDVATPQQLADPLTTHGRTSGGGTILLRPATAAYSPVPVTVIVSADGVSFDYALMGGP